MSYMHLATIEWFLERKPTEVEDIKHGWFEIASVNGELTILLICDNLEMKAMIDKLYNDTFTEMTMYSYYTSGIKFVTDV